MAKIILRVFFIWILIIKPVLAKETILRIPLHASTISLDPSKVQDTSSLWVSRQTNCQLVRINKGVSVLDAAQSIRYINPTLINVKLKRNLYFTNGTEVTAQDVIASFNYLRDKRSVLRNVFGWIEDMTLQNKYELLIKLRQPTPQLLTVLSASHYAIFEKTFITKVSKDPSLWREPVSCGDYKIDDSNSSFIKLSPIKEGGLPILFSLVPNGQLPAEELNKYDLISMQIIGKSNDLANFTPVNVFDPFQYYFVVNTRISPWNNKESRCALFAKINPKTVINIYGEKARKANDFLPSGTLGYVKDENHMKEIISKFKNAPIPPKQSFCVSFLATSIEKDYQPVYLDMIRKIYPNATSTSINSYIDLNDELTNKKCDGVFYAAKSNYLDAYEYFVTFSERGPSASGFYSKALAKQIQKSQEIDRADLRAKEYHRIVNNITRECLMYPLFTMPYDTVYVRNSLNAAGIGEGPINEYLLAKVRLANT